MTRTPTRVLITCPPMLGALESVRAAAAERGWTLDTPPVVQALGEEELVRLVPEVDGWIIGDDPANARVLGAGVAGNLRAAVKWGVGVDNVDFAAAERLGLSVVNTPGMFGDEVADVALAYVIGLARDLFRIDRQVRAGEWPKPAGTSLRDNVAALVGFGAIGREIATRLLACGLRVQVYEPRFSNPTGLDVRLLDWPEGLEDADYLVLACSLTPHNRHLVGDDALARCQPGVRVVNVARGALIDEAALARALDSGQVAAAALDVMEHEPLPTASPLRRHERCIFGSHNASNTREAVLRTNARAMELLEGLLREARR